MLSELIRVPVAQSAIYTARDRFLALQGPSPALPSGFTQMLIYQILRLRIRRVGCVHLFTRFQASATLCFDSYLVVLILLLVVQARSNASEAAIAITPHWERLGTAGGGLRTASTEMLST